MSSPILKSFTFVPQPKPSSDPLIIKRERMIARLEDQKKLIAVPNFVRTVKRWERTEGGEKALVEKPLSSPIPHPTHVSFTSEAGSPKATIGVGQW